MHDTLRKRLARSEFGLHEKLPHELVLLPKSFSIISTQLTLAELLTNSKDFNIIFSPPKITYVWVVAKTLQLFDQSIYLVKIKSIGLSLIYDH